MIKKYVRNYTTESEDAADGVRLPAGRGHNNERDAFRHIYISAVLVQERGSIASYLGGEAVEFMGKNTDAEHWMDRENNRLGREIGRRARQHNWSEDRIAREVKKLIDNGIAIVNPYDPRRTFDIHKDWDLAVFESEFALAKDKTQAEAEGLEFDEAYLQEGRQKSIQKFEENHPEVLMDVENEGEVEVKVYTREGYRVRAHTRGWPD